MQCTLHQDSKGRDRRKGEEEGRERIGRQRKGKREKVGRDEINKKLIITYKTINKQFPELIEILIN